MEQKIDIQELSIVIAVKGLNPTILNPDFLTYSGIVPTEWELARPPVLSTRFTQIIFQGGITIAAQPGSITFSESLNTKKVNEITVATLAHKYVETMPNAEYQAVSISPKRIVTFDDQVNGAHKYITETLLSSGSWQQIGNTPVQASVNLGYSFDHCRFVLNITENRLQLPDGEPIPAILFAGNFNYEINAEDVAARTNQLSQAIGNWQADLETYRNLLGTKFLPYSETNLAATA
jgi:hypothetical protein